MVRIQHSSTHVHVDLRERIERKGRKCVAAFEMQFKCFWKSAEKFEKITTVTAHKPDFFIWNYSSYIGRGWHIIGWYFVLRKAACNLKFEVFTSILSCKVPTLVFKMQISRVLRQRLRPSVFLHPTIWSYTVKQSIFFSVTFVWPAF